MATRKLELTKSITSFSDHADAEKVNEEVYFNHESFLSSNFIIGSIKMVTKFFHCFDRVFFFDQLS